MSSIIPWGKLGAEPTRSTVLLLMSRETLLTSTWYVGAGQATRWTLMPKYEPALRKAVWPVSGRILRRKVSLRESQWGLSHTSLAP
jgi:hypothetical protein